LRRFIIPLTLALVLVFAAAQVALAAWGQGFGGRGIGADGWANFAQELGITQEQSAQIQELYRQHFAKTNKIRDQLRATRQELQMQRWNPDADQARVQAQIDKAGELREQLRQEAIEFRTQLQGVLTEEQLAKWPQIRRGGPCLNPEGPLSATPRAKGGPWR
jgi:Spy/CpxP family protein refolding chaperone